MIKSVRCRLPELLAEKGWSRQEFADIIGSTKSQVSDWCRNRHVMKWPNAWICSQALKIPMEYLYEWVEQPIYESNSLGSGSKE